MTNEPPRTAPVALTPEVLAFLQCEGVAVDAAAGDVLVRRGEAGVAFWVILAGTVEVRLTGEDGVHLPLSRMGEGSTFGEMSLITGDPVSADVVALTPVRLLRYPAERFTGALGECARCARSCWPAWPPICAAPAPRSAVSTLSPAATAV